MNAPDPAKPRIDTPSRKGQPDPDEPVTFDLMPDEPATRPTRPAPAARASGADADDATDDDDTLEDGDGVDDDDSLPPPISRSEGVRVWLVIAGVCTSILAVSWLAGAPQLGLPTESGYPELGIGDRLVGLARTLVYLPLAALGATFGFLALAFLRQRPVGHFGALLAKSSAIVAIGMLLWLVPTEIRFLKQVLNTVLVPVVAGACAIPILRLSPRDAALATGFALMGMLLLVLASAVVVWAVGA